MESEVQRQTYILSGVITSLAAVLTVMPVMLTAKKTKVLPYAACLCTIISYDVF